MVIKTQLLFILLFLSQLTFAQETVRIQILDSSTNEALVGATVYIEELKIGAVSNSEGIAEINTDKVGVFSYIVAFTGYKEIKRSLTLPFASDIQLIYARLASNTEEFEELLIEITRSNRTVASLPTRTEVLTEEIDEAASMEPSRIAHLITHSTGIQVQTTSATSNGAVVRVQGLNGRYTQMLKDGFPLYGGFSGSLDVLQIPPLDLRQVEYVKGPASTLYGGGAIGGVINLLTKKPKVEESLLHLNMSHIGARDLNAFMARDFGKFGFTNLASFHLHNPYDPDKDGYSDIPSIAKFNFNPKLFYTHSSKLDFYLGLDMSHENRSGGDMQIIDGYEFDSIHFYRDQQESQRVTSQFAATYHPRKNQTWTLKNSLSSFDRSLQIRKNVAGETSVFKGRQENTFTELNYRLTTKKHNVNIGSNFNTDNFAEHLVESSSARDQSYTTFGFYVNHLWDVNQQLSLESGLRSDVSVAEGIRTKLAPKLYLLPRFSALYRINERWSIRAGGGMGYRMPTIFNEEAEPFGYEGILPIDFSKAKAERSSGANADFKYRYPFKNNKGLITFNQMFFYNEIQDYINLVRFPIDHSFFMRFENSDFSLVSRGFESQLKMTIGKFTWFLGYTYTDAYYDLGFTQSGLLLTPKHSIKGDLLFVEEEKWRIGWDYEFKSSQIVNTRPSRVTQSLFTTGIVVERTIDNFVIFLNAENFTDVRQSKYESTISGPYRTPQFTEIWAPLDGFFFNAGLKIKLK